MSSLTLTPFQRANGVVNLPGSKSLSNRALLISALAEGKTKLTNLLDSDDVHHMLDALSHLNLEYELNQDRTECSLSGQAGSFHLNGSVELFLGNAGTAMRPLCAALCLGSGEFLLTGEPRMYERPIADLVDCLITCGAKIEYLGAPGFPPLKVYGSGLTGGNVSIRGNISSQYLSSILMVAPYCHEDLTIKVDGELVSKPYVQMTIDLMSTFSVHVENHDFRSFRIQAGQKYISPGSVLIEGDASSASYFLAAGAIAGGSVRVEGVGSQSTQGDVQFANVLEKMGANVKWGKDWIEVSKKELNAIDLDLNHIPDAAMTIATTALFARGTTVIRNIYNWRVKETDRIEAMATELRKLGATVKAGDDFICITPPEKIRSAVIDTYNDHRIAMCFSLAAFGDSPITINDPECTSKTFPEYFNLLKGISA